MDDFQSFCRLASYLPSFLQYNICMNTYSSKSLFRKLTWPLVLLLLAALACNIPGNPAAPTQAPAPEIQLPTAEATAAAVVEVTPAPSSTPETARATELPTLPAVDLKPTITPVATNTRASGAGATPTKALTVTVTPISCPGTPISRLQVGDPARVTFTNGQPLRVRSSPEVKDNNVITFLAEGKTFKIIDGPVCAAVPKTSDAFLFWKIQYGAATGWAAEGDKTNYFIEKWPQ